jgi:hypothetical protein
MSMHWNRWIDHHDKRRARYTSNWRNVSDETEIEALVERRVDRVRSGD